MRARVGVCVAIMVVLGPAGRAGAYPSSPATPASGADECWGGVTQPQCRARPFGRASDLAWSGNGLARPAVAKDAIAVALHKPANVNDGYYGNGSAWVSASASSWVKIDLGRVVKIDGIRLGRDRTGGYADRLTGGFVVSVTDQDATYAAGDATNDAAEYRDVFEATAAELAGMPASATLVASFTPTSARYVKVLVRASGAALDEIEVSGVDPDACEASPCDAGMACTDRPGLDLSAAGRTCACLPGHGPLDAGGCADLDECALGTDTCVEDCTNTVGGFTCQQDDAWTGPGEPGFLKAAGAGALHASELTTLGAVRVPSSALGATARLVVRAGAGTAAVTFGATVPRSADARTELPVGCTLFPGRAYTFTVETDGRAINLGVTIPLDQARFAIIPPEITIPPVAAAATGTAAPRAAAALALTAARGMVLTGVVTSRVLEVTVADPASGTSIAGKRAPLDPFLRTAVPLGAGRSYLMTLREPLGAPTMDGAPIARADACAARTAGSQLSAVEGACDVAGASVWAARGPVTLRFTQLGLQPGGVWAQAATMKTVEIRGSGPAAWAYELRVSQPISIGGVRWRLAATAPESIEARVWDEHGAVLARGLPVTAGLTVAWYDSALTFTFEPGRTYLVGFTAPRGAMQLPAIVTGPDLAGVVADPSYALGPITITGVRSSRVGAADAAPTTPNVYAPWMELVLTPGTCVDGACP